MRTIIAGWRGVSSYNIMLRAIDAIRPKWMPTVVISGTAPGADRLGERWAIENGVPVERFPADWDRYGKRAGYLRNEQMGDHAEALLALWDGNSRGTKHMIDIANRKRLLIYVYRIDYPLSGGHGEGRQSNPVGFSKPPF